MAEFTTYLQNQRDIIENYLSSLLVTNDHRQKTLYNAMNYSLLGGGKRIRPILFMTVLEVLNCNPNQYLKIASAIECVHTYSLIHDDLPCMDDDDYRRGRPTCHKKFSPAIATLAGDGLLTYAFELIASADNLSAETILKLVQELAIASGPSGMVGGQAFDILSEGEKLSGDELRYMDSLKTGKLLAAPIDMAALIGTENKEVRHLLHEFGLCLGLLFQITDDILDEKGDFELIGKTVGQDKKAGKSTYVTLLGLEKAIKIAAEKEKEAKIILSELKLENSVLAQFPGYILNRNH